MFALVYCHTKLLNVDHSIPYMGKYCGEQHGKEETGAYVQQLYNSRAPYNARLPRVAFIECTDMTNQNTLNVTN